ncbi:MAG: hypothetical protein HZY76_11380 [Anaerolineae bacterium]|nr:MAG: hypothetical protein HZY76_11380 [Anaerolineae bacterium]
MTKLGVTVRQLGNTPLLWANITLTTPQETRIVPVVAQWQDAPTAAVAPAQAHQILSGAPVQQPAQIGIARETAPAASPPPRFQAGQPSGRPSRRWLGWLAGAVALMAVVALLWIATAPPSPTSTPDNSALAANITQYVQLALTN